MTPDAIAKLLTPYVPAAAVPAGGLNLIYEELAVYLDLILKWNARTNLTAIRNPEEIVRRHFGESLFVSGHLGNCSTLLDFGSGAGFPGVPIQLMLPNLAVTLGESQGKKAAFLREVCRELKLQTEVFSGRIETMSPDQRYDVVAMRAVDDMAAAITEAATRARHRIVILTTQSGVQVSLDGFQLVKQIRIPESARGCVDIYSCD